MDDGSLLRQRPPQHRLSSSKKNLVVIISVVFVAAVVTLGVVSHHKIAGKNFPNSKSLSSDFQEGVQFSSPSDDSEYEFPWRVPEAWDVTADHDRIYRHDDLDEGTWMALDVSPDGETIVFDLLGDLYTLPITGGEATLLKGGVTWDWQPQFTPDGNQILFTSDESGIDNLWLMDVDGTNQRRITNETYRFVSNGMINHAQDMVVGVKRYTTSRSLPAGELWQYEISEEPVGGVQLVGRINADTQVGPEEPVYSRDDQYVYYSQNTADSQLWEYNKDPHQGIYSIRRVNVETGTIETITGGNGGAARPMLSHDGSTLAFVRRRVFDTALVTRNLETGNERVISRKLSPDQQTSSATCGVYPKFAWTPDDQNVVIWAEGKLRSIEVSSGDQTEIPFKVDVELQLSETAKAQADPGLSRSFGVRVVQTAEISPDQSTAYFNALGHYYRKDLIANSPPQRISQRDEFEFMGTLSFNARFLVHVVWDDANLARIEAIDVVTNNVFILVDIPGRYADPVFSNDVTQLTYTRLGLDSLSGVNNGLGAGVYVISIEFIGGVLRPSGEPRLITTATSSEFAANGQSLVIYRGSTTIAEVSISEPSTERVLVSSSFTSSLRLSPDRRFVAFIQFRQIYIADMTLYEPDPDTGEIYVTARPDRDGDGLVHRAIVRLSENGGYFLSWSHDSQYIRWLLGPELHEIYIPAISTSCGIGYFSRDGKFDDCIGAITKVYNLGFVHNNEDISNNCVAFTGANILTMVEGEPATSGSTIVAVGDRIHDVGLDSEVDIPDGCERYETDGGLVIPGFMDVHAHFSASNRFFVQQNWQYVANLAFGITTNHNPSIDTANHFYDAELIRSGMKLGPRLYATGTIVYGADSAARIEINDLDDAYQVLRHLEAYGAFSAKSYQIPTRSGKQRLLTAARDLGMSIVPEGGMNIAWNTGMLVDGITTIEHNIPVSPLYDDIIHLFAESGSSYVPTQVVNYGQLMGEHYWYQHTNVWENSRLLRFSPNRAIEARSLRPEIHAQDVEYDHIRVAEAANRINELGGLVGCGAHGQRQGLGFHWEMWSLAQGGMSNERVLRAATANGAEAIGLTDIGRLQVGHLADFIVYPPDKNPLEEIRNTEFVRWVAIDGRVFEAETMRQIFPEDRPLPEGPILDIPELSGNVNNHNPASEKEEL